MGEVSLEVLSLVHRIATPRLEVVDLQPRRLLHAQLASLGGYIHDNFMLSTSLKLP